MLPDKHPQEAARLAQLRALEILDTAPEREFDDITALAAHICDTPIALVSLVDADRQWFKARRGVQVCETDLPRSVCAHAILGEGALVIEDTTRHPLSADNPLNDEIGMRFYAGVPLVGEAGLPLGSLCVLDTRPRRLGEERLAMLTRLARQTVRLIETRSAYLEAQKSGQELTEALRRQEVLREEIDHRVKNSLTQVAALLRLEAANTRSDDLRGVLDRARSRVQVIAEVHHELNRAPGVEEVDLAVYGRHLEQNFAQILPPEVSLAIELPDVCIRSRHASHLAILLNECVANASEHGLSGRSGKIEVRGRLEAGVLRVEVKDDGRGRDTPFGEGTGLGDRIIEAAAQSLSGRLEVIGQAHGFGLSFTFPLTTLTAPD